MHSGKQKEKNKIKFVFWNEIFVFLPHRYWPIGDADVIGVHCFRDQEMVSTEAREKANSPRAVRLWVCLTVNLSMGVLIYLYVHVCVCVYFGLDQTLTFD